VEILLEAGVPAGVINLLHGLGEEAGAPLSRHPDIALVPFAGSPAVGREVAIACAAEQKQVALVFRQGGLLLVLEDADLDAAVEAAARGAFAAAGQGPAATRRILTHRKVARDFAVRLAACAAALRLGDGLAPASEVGPLINEARVTQAHALARLALEEGAGVLCGGEPYRDGECRRGFFYAPTVPADVRPAMRSAQGVCLRPSWPS
jgi:aldehyde dehydrogenase (NAD+)